MHLNFNLEHGILQQIVEIRKKKEAERGRSREKETEYDEKENEEKYTEFKQKMRKKEQVNSEVWKENTDVMCWY